MSAWKSFFVSFTGALLLAAMQPSIAATAPQPPATICVNSTCATTPAASAGQTKWHPGVYVWTSGSINCSPSMQAQDFNVLDSISSDTHIKGIELVVWWNCLEGNTQGDYSAGFAYVDAYLAKLASLKVPKRLILKIENEQYLTGTCSGSTFAPLYLTTEGLNVTCTSTSAWSTEIWTTAGMNALMALSNAYAARYDSNPLFEMFTPMEQTALAVGSAGGYTASGFVSQVERYMANAKQNWKHTLVRVPVNYINGGGDSTMAGLIANVVGNGVILGGPDTLPPGIANYTVTANYIFRGCASSSSAACALGSIGTNYALTNPWLSDIESPDLAGGAGQTCANCTLQDLQSYAHDTMHDNYIIWYLNSWEGSSSVQWGAEQAFIDSGASPVYSTSCPSSFTSGCNTN